LLQTSTQNVLQQFKHFLKTSRESNEFSKKEGSRLQPHLTKFKSS